MKLSCNTLLCISLIAFTSFFGREKSLDDTQLIERKEVNSAQLIRMKEVNSNESLNGSIKSVGVNNFTYKILAICYGKEKRILRNKAVEDWDKV